MSIWIGKESDNNDLENYENYNSIQESDIVYLYTDDYESGTFRLVKKYDNIDDSLDNDIGFNEKSIDLPYTLLYKTKSASKLISMTEKEIKFILNPIDLSQAEEVNEEIPTYGNESSPNDTIDDKRTLNFNFFIIFNCPYNTSANNLKLK